MENNLSAADKDLESSLLAISVPDYDTEYHKTRRKLVRQRFALGLVQMFEQFPDLPRVQFKFGENVASMISVPQIEGMDEAQRVSLDKKVKKALQSARAAICPQSRDTASALELFFNPMPRIDRQTVILDRWLFSRATLPHLCAPEVMQLNAEFIALMKKQELEKVAHSIPEATSQASPRNPKM